MMLAINQLLILMILAILSAIWGTYCWYRCGLEKQKDLDPINWFIGATILTCGSLIFMFATGYVRGTIVA